MNSKGVTLLWMGLFLLLLLGFGALAVDFAYMYYVKNELQVAADAAALAGAGAIGSTGDTVQTAARAKAAEFAAKNLAGGDPAVANVVTVGLWNGTAYVQGVTPVNAVYVWATKTVGIFFGRVFGFARLTATAEAVAMRPPAPTTALSVCIKTCVINTPTELFFKEQQQPVPDPESTVAWSELSCSKATDLGPNSTIAKLIKGEVPTPNVCGKCIMSNNSHGTVLLKILEDEYNKRKNPVTGLWQVIVPVLNKVPSADACQGSDCKKPPDPTLSACPPGDQTEEPFLVERYAVMNISAVFSPPGKPRISVHSMGCVNCPATELLGRSTVLVR